MKVLPPQGWATCLCITWSASMSLTVARSGLLCAITVLLRRELDIWDLENSKGVEAGPVD